MMQKAQMAPEPVSLEVCDPTGGVEVTQLFSPRLPDLDGKVICELSNRMWEAPRTFPFLRELLKKKYPNTTIIPYEETPFFDERTSVKDLAEIARIVKEKGVQGAIIGNAG